MTLHIVKFHQNPYTTRFSGRANTTGFLPKSVAYRKYNLRLNSNPTPQDKSQLFRLDKSVHNNLNKLTQIRIGNSVKTIHR